MTLTYYLLPGEYMKLIDDEKLNEDQISWFNKHIKTFDIKCFNVTGLSEKDSKVKEILGDYSNIQICHLKQLRELLNSTGLKKLSNSLASAKKRRNSNKRSLQVMLNQETINKLELLVKNKGMSMSQFIESLV